MIDDGDCRDARFARRSIVMAWSCCSPLTWRHWCARQGYRQLQPEALKLDRLLDDQIRRGAQAVPNTSHGQVSRLLRSNLGLHGQAEAIPAGEGEARGPFSIGTVEHAHQVPVSASAARTA